jgi:acyl-CoA synthetase (AMP-forming)/AMP-acid ligase II
MDSSSRFAERTAIVDGEARLTYGELGELVRSSSEALIASGVVAGDRVCVWSPNTFHWVVAALAAHSAGAVLVPLNTRFTGVEALDVLRRTRARVLFLPDRFLGRDYLSSLCAAEPEGADAPFSISSDQPQKADRDVPVRGLPDLALAITVPVEGLPRDAHAGVLTWQEFQGRAEVTAQEAEARALAVAPEDLCDILFTSGTTGRPKGAMSSHRQTIAVAQAWADRAEVTSEDRYLIINPFFHSFGYKAGFIPCLLRGATILPQLTFDIERTLELVEREGVTILPGPPTIYQTLLEHPGRSEHDTSSLRLAVTGSAMVPVALVERMARELSFKTIITAYGLSEAVVVSMCKPGDDPETISRTSGCATAGFEIKIVDAVGRELAAGEAGEILLRGPNVMLGYLDDPQATAEAIEPDGWLHTGDIGNLDERGYLTITDRLKDMFTVGGFNVFPAEIENALLRLEGVLEVAAIGVPDERLGSVGKVFIVGRSGHELTSERVLAFCRDRLANFKVPRGVEFVDALPRSAAGKVLKHDLPRGEGAKSPGMNGIVLNPEVVP